jgi:exopolysaccharide biosynthesis protein
VEVPDDENYQTSSMLEQHPRSAVGWNREHLFLVTVDGRQRGSIGMTLEELASYLIKLGCDEAMNLDGGGSATLWCQGQLRNQPCDGRERPVANSLVVVRRNPAGK